MFDEMKEFLSQHKKMRYLRNVKIMHKITWLLNLMRQAVRRSSPAGFPRARQPLPATPPRHLGGLGSTGGGPGLI